MSAKERQQMQVDDGIATVALVISLYTCKVNQHHEAILFLWKKIKNNVAQLQAETSGS